MHNESTEKKIMSSTFFEQSRKEFVKLETNTLATARAIARPSRVNKLA